MRGGNGGSRCHRISLMTHWGFERSYIGHSLSTRSPGEVRTLSAAWFAAVGRMRGPSSDQRGRLESESF